MKILGIDPGYGLCGFAVLEKQKSDIKLETFGVIRTKSQKNFAARLLEIAKDFESLLKKYKPDVLSIEDLFFVQNVTTGLQVAQVRGVLMFLAHKAGMGIVEPKPVEVKSCFTGDGKADKTQMKKMAQTLFCLSKTPKLDDAADAIAVAYWAAQKSRIS
ncbi:crossover junction endodeoxyribonuclease RuvC [Candidatus Gracilibacteria bacterium]|nr:crossover junction endodeoxyribonuclease RuvC [Candidatus Gracilibacteria bacterium]